jgi:hypothetical protein
LFSRGVADSLEVLWALLEDSPVGGVVEGCFTPEEADNVVGGLRRCGADPAVVPELWCAEEVKPGARPLGLGPTVAVRTGHSLERADLVRIALQVAAGLAPTSET